MHVLSRYSIDKYRVENVDHDHSNPAVLGPGPRRAMCRLVQPDSASSVTLDNVTRKAAWVLGTLLRSCQRVGRCGV